MKIGFEMELFLLKNGQPELVPYTLPMDECGWLVEVRSEPHHNITKAISLFKAEIETVTEQANALGFELVQTPLYKIPRELKVQAARRSGKGILKYKNIYGHETHKNRSEFATASIHVSFTEQNQFEYTTGSCNKCHNRSKSAFHYQGFIDHAKYIVGLDMAFKEEIKKAKRNPGFYEIKSDGRIEYRSLPNDVDLKKLRDELEKLVNGKIPVEVTPTQHSIATVADTNYDDYDYKEGEGEAS